MKRLVVCCDGTWNRADQALPTSVARLAAAVRPTDGRGVAQRVFYDPGVGTGRWDRLLGGLVGWGLSRNVQEAYHFLVREFEPGDELWLFGFSRGAYTARSVVGFVRNAGLLRREWEGRLAEAYALYRDRTAATHPRGAEAARFRRSFAHETRVWFVGVWDTVGALGIPLDVPGVHLVNDRWKFHDVKLSTWVDHAFQALAIDERRRPFAPTLWEQQPDARGQTLRQVWFAGTHRDVGGGAPASGLGDLALRWMLTRAHACGLALDWPLLKPDVHGPLHESMTWYYRPLGELVRPIGAPRVDAEGRPVTTGEAAATSALARLADSAYRPPNLLAFRARGGPVVPV